MKTNITPAILFLVLVSGCATKLPARPTIEVSASQTLAYETTIASVNETATANAPTELVPAALLTLTARPTATDVPTSTPLPTHTPLPELLPNAIDLRWITAYRLSGAQFTTRMYPTKDGGFILVGNTVANNRYSALLLKLRADGFILWQTSFPQVRALNVLETSAGDFILGGDLHWIKLDSQGNLLWQHTFEGHSYHIGLSFRLVEESNGNIVAEAPTSRTVFNADGELQSFTETTDPGGVIDRLDANQFIDMVFARTTADGGALVGNRVIEDVGDVASMLSHVVISRFSGDGSVRWQKDFGGYVAAEYEDFNAFVTRSGDIIVAGTLHYYAENSPRGGDVWVLRLNNDGNPRWERMYATAGQDAVTIIQELSNGDLIFAGQTSGAGTGDQDMWVLKANAEGEIPNCGLMLDGDTGFFGHGPELETIPIFEGEQRPFGDNADAQVIPLCAARPSPYR